MGCNALTEITKIQYDSSSEEASRERESRSLNKQKKTLREGLISECTCFGTRDQRRDGA